MTQPPQEPLDQWGLPALEYPDLQGTIEGLLKAAELNALEEKAEASELQWHGHCFSGQKSLQPHMNLQQQPRDHLREMFTQATQRPVDVSQTPWAHRPGMFPLSYSGVNLLDPFATTTPKPPPVDRLYTPIVATDLQFAKRKKLLPKPLARVWKGYMLVQAGVGPHETTALYLDEGREIEKWCLRQLAAAPNPNTADATWKPTIINIAGQRVCGWKKRDLKSVLKDISTKSS